MMSTVQLLTKMGLLRPVLRHAFCPACKGWLMMMAAMMLPTAVPLVFEFARHSGRRAGWQVATSLLIATYLAVWLAFGVATYLVYDALRMPWADQRLIGGASLVLAYPPISIFWLRKDG